MVTNFRRVTIIKITKPREHNLNKEIQWFSDSLGLFGPRDKEKSLFRIFIALLKAAKYKRRLTSDEIAEEYNLSRSTVHHHLSNLMQRGIVNCYDNKYSLSVNNLRELVASMKKELYQTLDDLREMAEKLDKELGLI